VFMMLNAILPSVSFAGNIFILTGNGELYNWILRLSPNASYTNMLLTGLYDPSISIQRVLSGCWMDIASLLLFIIIIMTLCYTSFIRRDIV
jgi:ABC-type transport system involved in multi-copper enzyme maturation permease subunit